MPGPIHNNTPYNAADQLEILMRAVNPAAGRATPASLESPKLAGDAFTKSDSADVIIVKPRSKTLGKSEAPALKADDLKSLGISGEDLPLIGGVEATVSNAAKHALEEQGYLVYDNSPRKLLPEIPKATKKFFKDDGSMPRIDPAAMTRTDAVQKAGFTGKGQVVAVIDSGFNHPAEKLAGWHDVVDQSPKPIDPNGHGTHVAGDVKQMAPDAKLVSIRVMNQDGQGRPSDIIKGLQWAISQKDALGISVINMSLGGPPDGVSYLNDPISQAVGKAVKAGITVVDAAGNSGPKPHTIGSPAEDPRSLTVGSALNPATVSEFSSRGPTDDHLDKPDVMAPGEFITSWGVPGSQLDKIATVVDGIRHMTPDQITQLLKKNPKLIDGLGLPRDIMSRTTSERANLVKQTLPPVFKPTPDTIAAPGTSFAAPEVAGIVADLLQANPAATPDQIKQDLMDTAHTMGGKYGKDDQGAGFVQSDAALRQALADANGKGRATGA